MATTVTMNGTQKTREVKVIRKQTFVIKNAQGEEQKVKLTLKKQDPSTMSETDKSLAELNKLFPKQTKPKEVEQYSSVDDYVFAQEMQSQIAKFEESNRHGRRGRRNRGNSGHKQNRNDWS